MSLDPDFGDAALPSVRTSHGLLDEELRWVCEEIGGNGRLIVDALRERGRWWLATTGGLLTSTEGCAWSLRADLPQTPLVRIVRAGPDELLVVGYEGVWSIPADAESDASEVLSTELSLRDAWRLPDASLYLLGFEAGLPVLEIGDQHIELPVASGAMSLALVDTSGRAYVRVPVGLEHQLFRVSPDGEIEDLLGRTAPLAEVAEHKGALYVVQRGHGTRWSTDDGLSWSEPRGPLLNCLRPRADELYACPEDGASILARETSGASDPAAWTFETLSAFAEVEPMSCAADTTFDAQCTALWPLVQAQLGAGQAGEDESGGDDDTGESGARPEPGAGGCTLETGPSPSPAAWTLLGLCFALFRPRRP